MLLISAVAALLGFGIFYNIRATSAQDQPDMTVMAKLQEITSNQKIILQKLDEIKEDLYVVKIRASKK